MDSMKYLFEPVAGAIPDLFRSHDNKECMDHCIMCDDELLLSGRNYLIEKAIRKYPDYKVADCIFEYAICFDCAQKMQENISEDSLKKMNAFFESNVNFPERSRLLYDENKFDVNDWTNKCIIDNTDRDDSDEFQIYGHFVGDKMIYSVFPYMISHKAIDQLTSLLSKQTKDELDGFVDEHFGLPPEYKDLLKDRPLVLI